MGAVSSAAGAVVDVVEDVGSTLDDIVVQPTISVVEGSIDLSLNSLQTAAKTAEQLAQGDVQGAYDETSQGLAGAEDVVSNTWLEIRDPLQAAAVIGGNYLLPGSSLITSQLVSDEAQTILDSNGGRILNVAAGATGGYQGNTANYGKIGESMGFTSTDPNAVGGATGPDNIDVGGGFNPADGATNSVSAGSPSILSSADKQALYSNAGYGDTMTSAQISAFDKAVASGMTVSGALNVARGALLVNALTGDPLGLNGGTGGGGGGGGSTGFAQVPIPAEWQSPTYAAPSAPIDLSSIFSNQNMLGGTQWQNLPSQQPNVSFNDIFASGQQQTPMGTPVDINQIVSAILGQAATSQKPA
jgi:hypothetical protein